MFERMYFVVAPNFDGATLLSKSLNDRPEVISPGDTYPSNPFDQLCGCGERVSCCEYWQAVARSVDVDRYGDCPHLLPDYPRVLGARKDRWLYNMASPHRLERMMAVDQRRAFAANYMMFTTAVHACADRPRARIFVDGVKSISQVLALAACGVQIAGVIYLRRNPGDYIQSVMKLRGYSRRAFVQRLLVYRLFHNRTHSIGWSFPMLSVAYEGLAGTPQVTLDWLFRFIGVAPLPLPKLLDERRSRPRHFMGNAALFHFDGTFRPSHHKQTRAKSMFTQILAGRYRRRSDLVGDAA